MQEKVYMAQPNNVNGLQPYEVDLREMHIAGHGYKIMIKRLLREA